MATDSTELTFVRCPACRSLVPAVSTRCRMCGAPLEGGALDEGENAKGDQSAGRVRQRTMSAPQEDLTAAADQIRSELGGAESAESRSARPAPAQSAPQPPAAQQPVQASPAQSGPAAPEPAPQPKPPAEPVQAKKEIPIDDPLSAFIEEVEVPEEPDSGAEAREVKTAAAVNGKPAPAAETPGSKVIVETGGKKSQKSQLSFGKQEAREKAEPEPAPKKEQKQAMQRQDAEQQASQAKQQRVEPQQTDEPEQRQARLEPKKAKKDQPQKKAQQNQKAEPKQKGPKPSAKTRPGRLFGWLVSYDDPDGTAIELREGKFFVASERLKENDLIIAHPSVSTPHAMVSISPGNGFTVQDLLSEGEVFVKRSSADKYEKVPDTVRLQQGDWVKFGEVEYLVSLIAHVGKK